MLSRAFLRFLGIAGIAVVAIGAIAPARLFSPANSVTLAGLAGSKDGARAPIQHETLAKTFNVSWLRTAQSDENTCREDHPDHPFYCAGADVCCVSASTHYCRKYRGTVYPQKVGKSGCVSPESDEALKEFSTNCELFVKC